MTMPRLTASCMTLDIVVWILCSVPGANWGSTVVWPAASVVVLVCAANPARKSRTHSLVIEPMGALPNSGVRCALSTCS